MSRDERLDLFDHLGVLVLENRSFDELRSYLYEQDEPKHIIPDKDLRAASAGPLLALELLVAADIVYTVAADPGLESLGLLGLLVVIRTLLSFTLELEVAGRWPWQRGDGMRASEWSSTAMGVAPAGGARRRTFAVPYSASRLQKGAGMSDQASSMGGTTTDWARERTRLAKERTFAALVRTVLAFIGFGIAIAKLLPDLHPAWVVRTVGILLIAGGGVTAYLGSRSIHDVITKLREEGVKEPRWFVTITTLLLLVTAILALLVVGQD